MEQAGKLRVHIRGAKEIKGTESFGLGIADPYAKIKCGRQFFKTKTAHNGGSFPVWDEAFTFDIQESSPEWLYVEIYDEDRFTKDDDLGTARILLSRVLKDHNNTVPESNYYVMYKGTIRGSVQLSLTFTPNREAL